MTNKIIDFYLSIETVVNGLITLVVSIFMSAVTQLAPLAAPIPPAFSVYTAMRVGLAVPEYIAILAAIAIEITGIFSARTAIRAKHWNDTRLKSDPEASLVLSISMSAIFFVVVLILSFTIELWPSLVVWVYPGFVLISVTVYTNMGLAMSLNSWEKGKDAVREDRRREAKEKRMLSSGKVTKIDALQSEPANGGQLAAKLSDNRPLAGQEWPTSEKLAVGDRRVEVEKLRLAGMARQEMANELGVSLGTIKNDLRIISNGKVN